MRLSDRVNLCVAPCPPRRGGPVSVWSPEDDLVAAFLREVACARRDSHARTPSFRDPDSSQSLRGSAHYFFCYLWRSLNAMAIYSPCYL